MPTDSGIRPVDDVLLKYKRVLINERTGNSSKKLPYAIFKFNHEVPSKSKEDPDKIIVDYDKRYYEKQCTYAELLSLLPTDSVRYVAFDFPYWSKDNMKSSAVLFISWTPPASTMKQKFKMMSSVEGLKRALGIPSNKNRNLEGDIDDVDETAIMSKNSDWKPCPPEMLGPLSQEPFDFEPEGDDF